MKQLDIEVSTPANDVLEIIISIVFFCIKYITRCLTLSEGLVDGASNLP